MEFLILFGVALCALGVSAARHKRAPARTIEANTVDVSVLTFAIDWRARRYIQRVLRELEATVDARELEAAHDRLRAATNALRHMRPAWLYAGIVNSVPLPASYAGELFRRHTDAARRRLRHEVGRFFIGGDPYRGDYAESERKPRQEGIAVVTIAVAARQEIADFPHVSDAAQLGAALDAIASVPAAAISAIDVVWVPGDESAYLVPDELERMFPRLSRVRGVSLDGRVFCAECGAVAPEELPSCPDCGHAA